MSISLRSRLSQQPQIIYHTIFFAIWAFTLYTGIMGVDFRTHWDERKLFKSIRNSIPVGKIIPGWYNYPSMIYDLAVLTASPEIISTYLADRSTFRDNMEQQLLDDSLRQITLRTRTVFLIVTTLALLWTYLLVHLWTRQWLQALLSSAILASSWELAYHARWVAPDAILMQFGILTVMLVFVALRSSGRRQFMWLLGAAVAAGMAAGTKYFGGIFLLPVFMAGYKLLKDSNPKNNRYVLWSLVLLAVFSLTFLLITPGALIETAEMIRNVRYEMGHYQSGDMGYTVRAGWEHLSLLLTYLLGVYFSNYLWLSLLFGMLALVGLYALLARHGRKLETWIFLCVPLLFIPYMSQQRVMMVRNDLLLFPFLAILSACGMMAVCRSKFVQSRRVLTLVLPIALMAALTINFHWLYYAADTISPKLTIDWTQKLDTYLMDHGETTFYLSPGTTSLFDASEFPNVVDNPLQAEKLIFVFSEVNYALSNRPNVYEPIFGPYEVNFDYYTSWNEDERIMVMPMKAALSQKQFEFIHK